jgi:hypothetical protein
MENLSRGHLMQQNDEGQVVTTGDRLEDQETRKTKMVKNVKMEAEIEGRGVEGAVSAEGEDMPLDISVGVEVREGVNDLRAKAMGIRNNSMMTRAPPKKAAMVKKAETAEAKVVGVGVAVEVAEVVVGSLVVSIVVEVAEEVEVKVTKMEEVMEKGLQRSE